MLNSDLNNPGRGGEIEGDNSNKRRLKKEECLKRLLDFLFLNVSVEEQENY